MAKSGSIVDGFPKVKGFTLDNPVSDGVKSHSLNTSFSTGNGTRPGEHHRTWFIRQLSHEKYYQGEFSDYIPNSRFVFVEDALVNSNVKPKHVDI